MAIRDRLRRLLDPPRRALWVDDSGMIQRTDLLALAEGSTAAMRRANRTNADLVAVYSALFSAVRQRSTAVTKPRLVLVRNGRGGRQVEIDQHPVLDAIRHVNASLTFRQGFGLIEQHKLTAGSAYWVKRRNALGVVVEFEIWDPLTVEVIPDKARPWEPAAFRRRKSAAVWENVKPQDLVWFRHMVDPRDPLKGLSPIGAVRTLADTGLEAQRFNQRFFDNDALPAAILSAADAGPGEVERIEQEMARKFQGTDNKFRLMITEGELTAVALPMNHKDMQFLEQMRWGVEEVARVMEMAPVMLADLSHATYENAEQIEGQFWSMIQTQLENTLEEFNEFLVRPDFGDEFELVARYDTIPAMQVDRKFQAEVDEIRLRTGVIVVNEVRERDDLGPVEWGDVPLISTTMKPLGYEPPAPEPPPGGPPAPTPQQEPPRAHVRSVEQDEEMLSAGWERRLRKELRGIISHLEAADRRDFTPGDVGNYDWDWWRKYGPQVIAELLAIYEAALTDAGYPEGATIVDAYTLAVRYAEARAGDLIRLEGPQSLIDLTRDRVKALVSEVLAEGGTLRDLKNKLRADFAFSPSRAETIARTETAIAQGQGKIQAWQQIGYEGKRWVTAHDERVDGGNPSGPCIQNEGNGPIRLHEAFASGHLTVPAHPRCRCTILPVAEMPRRAIATTVSVPALEAGSFVIRKQVVRDAQGRITEVIEHHEREG